VRTIPRSSSPRSRAGLVRQQHCKGTIAGSMSQDFSVVGPHSKCRAKCRAGKCLSLNLLGFSDLFARLWADVLYPFQKFRVEVMNRFMFTEFLGHPDRRSRWRPKPHLRTWRQWQQSICQAMSGWMGCQLDQFWSLSLHHSTNLKQFKPIYMCIYIYQFKPSNFQGC
jgi:hypothetical protein